MNTTTSSLPPLTVIQAAYAAFRRGDISAILARLAPDVEWSANVDQSLQAIAHVPCYVNGRGRDFVAGYFRTFAASYHVHEFNALSFMVGGPEVAVRLGVDVTVRRTGRRIRTEVIHHWILNEQGEVTRFLDIEDTLGFVHAWS